MSDQEPIPAWPASLKDVGQALINLDKIWPIDKKNPSMDPLTQWRKFMAMGSGVYDIAGLKGIVIVIPMLDYEKRKAEERAQNEIWRMVENYNKPKVDVVPVCRSCMITPMEHWQQECSSCMGDTLRSDLENVQHSRAEHRADCMEGLQENVSVDLLRDISGSPGDGDDRAWDMETPLAILVDRPGSTEDCMYPMKRGGPCKRKPRKTFVENSYCKQHYDMVIAEDKERQGAEHDLEKTPTGQRDGQGSGEHC